MKGQLNEDQAKFMAPEKPEFELYDLEKDPYELDNLAYNSEYKDIKKEMLNKLNDWRENVIHDKGVTEEFRKGGWPADYPTKTLEEWEERLEILSKWVFREPTSDMKHPFYPNR